jgi:hypothetical protein
MIRMNFVRISLLSVYSGSVVKWLCSGHMNLVLIGREKGMFVRILSYTESVYYRSFMHLEPELITVIHVIVGWLQSGSLWRQ